MVLVAAAMVAIMAMAALSIDVVTLYVANADAQRSADAAALAAARVLSITGVTGDPSNNSGSWPLASSAAQTVAQSVANQNLVGGLAPKSVNVTVNNTSALFAVNPIVSVTVTSANLPTFFSRIWGKRAANVSATANAEAYNPSNSGAYTAAGSMVPVQPRCVKPMIVPNVDPQTGNTLVGTADGSITNPGIQLNYAGGKSGVIGEEFTLTSACTGTTCTNVQPPGGPVLKGNYIPAYVQNPPVAVSTAPGCALSDDYQEAIAGCDQSTVYACGTLSGAQADLSENRTAETGAAAQCLVQQPGQDSINTAVYPFQIEAGDDNPLKAAGVNGLNAGDVISASNSIITIPIMNGNTVPPGGLQPAVTIVGFLQVFIQNVNAAENPVVTILNVSGCSNAATQPPVTGSSPVPVRLIQPVP